LERIDEVEVKLAFLERHVLELDGVVRELADELRRVRAELADLHESSGEKPGNDKPPHY
jgi:uncharacterized coiled-coil protein SlyX